MANLIMGGYCCSICGIQISDREHAWSKLEFGNDFCKEHKPTSSSKTKSKHDPEVSLTIPSDPHCSICKEKITSLECSNSLKVFSEIFCRNHEPLCSICKTLLPRSEILDSLNEFGKIFCREHRPICSECGGFITEMEYSDSMAKFDMPLCAKHLFQLSEKNIAMMLTHSLKEYGPSSVDYIRPGVYYRGEMMVTFPDYGIVIGIYGTGFIEVYSRSLGCGYGGGYNQFSIKGLRPEEELENLRSTIESFKKGLFKLRIPDCLLVGEELDKTLPIIKEFLNKSCTFWRVQSTFLANKPFNSFEVDRATSAARQLGRNLGNDFGWEIKLEPYDGHKHVDIFVEKAKTVIEVDGEQHTRLPQASADLERTLGSFKDGLLTLRVPNCLIVDEKLFSEVSPLVNEFLKESQKKFLFFSHFPR